ncbi:Nucleotide-binding universal stress protein, UspA family [Blastococcus tunisiensis]|uniref:Nucleotide-binding universal stress protein, UspA family n=1 Tax=Blastococcus tunisiensis TaxID=1798228 RepID=A0A1I2JLT6_9ACTN|nr:Nucleotide-binding universal stress protein, UspA family [Blastococcus sp. DSM 46838]
MSTFLLALAVVLLWVLVGLVAVLLFLGRRGYRSGTWYLLGAVLGPLFLPIAMERGRRAPDDTEVAARRDAPSERLTVLVGVDGSAESDAAVREAARLFAPGAARVLLVGVADPDVAEFGDEARLRAWQDLLDDRAGWFPPGGAVPVPRLRYGQPDRVLLETADAEGADVLVVGRRGRGLSHLLLGSVADSLSRHAVIPVLLAGAGSAGPGAGSSAQLPAVPAQLGEQPPVGIPGDGDVVDAAPADDGALDRGRGDRFPQ